MGAPDTVPEEDVQEVQGRLLI